MYKYGTPVPWYMTVLTSQGEAGSPQAARVLSCWRCKQVRVLDFHPFWIIHLLPLFGTRSTGVDCHVESRSRSRAVPFLAKTELRPHPPRPMEGRGVHPPPRVGVRTKPGCCNSDHTQSGDDRQVGDILYSIIVHARVCNRLPYARHIPQRRRMASCSRQEMKGHPLYHGG